MNDPHLTRDRSTMKYVPEPACVEIVDGQGGGDGATFLAPDRVLINGHDVGIIAENGVRVDLGDAHSAATVTITLIPRRIDVRPADETSMPTIDQLEAAFVQAVGHQVGRDGSREVASLLHAALLSPKKGAPSEA